MPINDDEVNFHTAMARQLEQWAKTPIGKNRIEFQKLQRGLEDEERAKEPQGHGIMAMLEWRGSRK